MSNFKGFSSKERRYSLLTDAPQHKSTVIDWYFDAWGKRDPNNTLESYSEKLESFLQDGSIPAHVVICDGERWLPLRIFESMKSRVTWIMRCGLAVFMLTPDTEVKASQKQSLIV